MNWGERFDSVIPIYRGFHRLMIGLLLLQVPLKLSSICNKHNFISMLLSTESKSVRIKMRQLKRNN